MAVQEAVLKCPSCGSSKVDCNGTRELKDGSVIQRFICKCGYRFSPRHNNSKMNRHIPSNRQIGALEAKNLTFATKTNIVADDRKPLDEQTIKGKLLEFEFWMQKQGYKPSTIGNRIVRMNCLVSRGANLLDPENVKAVIALQKTWSAGTKANVVSAYDLFLHKEGLKWEIPRYKRDETIPFIPSEAELNQLIGAATKTLSIFLQGLKECGADPGELAAVESKDVGAETRTITLNHPVKGHRSRVLTVSQDLINRLKSLMAKEGRLFDDNKLRQNFNYLRKVAARKLGNPRLLEITFITFRHWFGTMEYHKTKDILHVQRLLGHRNIQNTLIYIDLETKFFNSSSGSGYTTRIAHDVGEAASLIEAEFEYVTGEYNDGGKIFRKRK